MYKEVQEQKHLLKQNDGNDRNGDRQQIASKLVDKKYFGGSKKWKKTQTFFNNNASQPKKKEVRGEENHVVQYKQNKITKLSEEHFIQRS